MIVDPTLRYNVQVAYTLFTQLVHWNGAHPLWNQTARPLLQQLLFLLETTLGPVQKLAFSMTHILLTALMLVIVIYVEKLREAIISANQR